MKRALLLLLAALLTACAAPVSETPRSAAIDLPIERPVTVVTVSAPAEQPAAIPTEPSTPAPTAIPTETPPDDCVHLASPIEDEPYPKPLIVPISLRSFDWDKANLQGDYETTYQNTTLDFADLRLTVEALDADKNGTTLRIRVRHPETWSLIESQNMNGYYLNDSVLLDGERADFRVTKKSVRLGFATKDDRCDDYTVTLHCDSLDAHTLATHKTLTVLPHVTYYRQYGLTNNSRQIENGVVCASLNERRHACHPWRTNLFERALNVDLEPLCHFVTPAALLEKQPLLYNVTIESEDIDRAIADGTYKKEGEVPWWGMMENNLLDFSDFAVEIDAFEFWDLGVRGLVHVHYPDSWTPLQKAYARPQVRMWIDGKSPQRDLGIRVLFPIGGDVFRDDAPLYRERITVRSAEEYLSLDRSDFYYELYCSGNYNEILQNAKEIRFTVSLNHVKTIRLDGKRWDLDENPTPVGDLMKYDILEQEKVDIVEKTVMIDPKTMFIETEE